MKNIKYYAGFFDADGSFDIDPTKRDNGTYYINVRATLYQKDREVLDEFAKYWGVEVKPSKGCFCVSLRGTKAEMFMKEVKRHLVVKRNIVEFLLPLKGTHTTNIKKIREEVKEARKQLVTEKLYPSRQWMAGYIDGDGCIHSNFRKTDGNLSFKLSVVSHVSQIAGLKLMEKAFGGCIVEQQDVRRWNIELSITKGKQLLEFFGMHLRNKKQQADLVLDCLRSKRHFRRNGASYEENAILHKTLQELKLPTTTKSHEQN